MIKADQIWWTRKAKIENESRLLRYEFHSQILLLWYSFCSVAISILTITNSSFLQKNLHTQNIDPKLLIVFSVLSLFMSTFVISQNFKERSAKVKNCYEKLKELHESLNNPQISVNDKIEISKKYQSLLDNCENHLDKDYVAAKVNLYLSTPSNGRSNISPHPTKYDYFKFAKAQLSYYIVLIVLYLFPLSLIFVV